MARQSREARNAKRRENWARKYPPRPRPTINCLGCGKPVLAYRSTHTWCPPCKREEEKKQAAIKRSKSSRSYSFVCCVCGEHTAGKQPNQKACGRCVVKYRRQRQYRRAKERLRSDPQYAASMLLRRRINNSLAHMNAEKTDSTMRLVGCSKAKLVEHLEKQFRPGMTWETRGVRGWHIDHIVPCAAFDLTDPEQQRRCFHYTNLQPLWWYENIGKSNKMKGVLF